MRTCHFQAQNGPFVPNENLFRKTVNIISIYLLTPFSVQNFQKKPLEQIQSYEHAPFLGQKWPICPK